MVNHLAMYPGLALSLLFGAVMVALSRYLIEVHKSESIWAYLSWGLGMLFILNAFLVAVVSN